MMLHAALLNTLLPAVEIVGQTDDPTAVTLNAGGWFMMTVSILMVCGLCAFCLYRILREPTPSGHHHAPLEVDTRDK